MHTLYDSDSFSVVHLLTDATADAAAGDRAPRHGFEIVDKRTHREVYLDGTWAELFARHLQAWQVTTPTQEEVENTLDSYTGLAQQPLVLH